MQLAVQYGVPSQLVHAGRRSPGLASGDEDEELEGLNDDEATLDSADAVLDAERDANIDKP